MSAPGWTIDELMCAVMARQIDDGDVVLEGIGTFLPAAAYELARATHAPRLTIFSAITGSFRDVALPLRLHGNESAAAAAATRTISYTEMVLWHLPAYLPRRPERWKEYLRPAQVDRFGHTNNVRIHRVGRGPVRLPGAVGIPDTMALHEQVHLYLPRHEPRVFTERVDVLSGVGGDGLGGEITRTRAERLVTDLGLFEFAGGALQVVSLHPGATLEQVRARTPIAVEAPDVPRETEPPTDGELDALRGTVDPLGLRTLEFLTSRERNVAIRALVEADAGAVSSLGAA
ncbi:MAG: ketoacid-CoA transferase [Solirubrobacterales bacterium]|nr:ketoacid-CoA transferase [Solirubrobacterales bacterium]